MRCAILRRWSRPQIVVHGSDIDPLLQSVAYICQSQCCLLINSHLEGDGLLLYAEMYPVVSNK